ncbi:right-handed parallel beta-helix repeat-containing protein [Geothrix limicola]|uniref:right-handed parallel beta-helix repeat-containing protein n=1 Tax=Geothrix limicola TaxID=2927978 RepID=UPI00255511B3|nr:right-handed parallel beta-helix repeat-containing protein [Geothrix limicola]
MAPNGTASNPGTLAAPTTLEGAQLLIRNAARSGPGVLRVLLRGGVYQRTSATFSLGATDSGSQANPVEYVAYPNETPRLVGGVSLDPKNLRLVDSTDPNWARLDATAQSKIYAADLSSVRSYLGSFSSRIDGSSEINHAMEVFANGVPLSLAQYPKAVDPESVNLTPQATLRVTGSITPDATGDYAYKGTDALGRPYYQLAKGGDLWSIAGSATGADWYLSNRRDLGGTGTSASWGTFESFAGPVGRFDPTSGRALGSAFLSRADGSNAMPGFMLIQGTNGSTQIQVSNSRMGRWRASEAMYYGTGYYAWSASHCALSSLDSASGTIHLASTPTYGLRGGQPFYVYNLLEELTDPGDYFIDRVNARLYLRPVGDAVPGEILLSTLQAPIVTMRSVAYVSWKGIVFESAQNNLVDAQACTNVTFANCLFRNAGGWGLLLSGASNLVEACELTQLGKGGVWVCGGDRHTLTSSGTVIENSRIHHYGRLFWSYQPGINIDSITKPSYSDDCSGITVQHNEIHHAPHQAMLFQGNNHTIRYNHIHHVCQWVNDAGALYSQRDWGSQGNLVQYNLIRHSGGPFGVYVLGIYLDSGGSGVTIEGNILYKSGAALALQHNGGRDVKIRYNVMSGYWFGAVTVNYGTTMVNNVAGSSLNLLEKLNHFNYQAAPWSTAYPTVAAIPNDWTLIQGSHWLEPENCIFYGNLFQGSSADAIRQENVFPGLAPPLTWFTQVSNNLSQVDPLFMDPVNLDFRLKPESPMYSIPGFPGIDASKIGVQP